MRHHAIALVPSLLLCGGLIAAEGLDAGLKIDIGYAPALISIDGYDFKDKGSAYLAPGIVVTKGIDGGFGCRFGANLFLLAGQSEGDESGVDGVDVDVAMYGARIFAGGVYAINDKVSISLSPFAGLSYATLKYDGGLVDRTDDGLGLSYGLILAGEFHASKNLNVGLYVGAEGSSLKMNNDDTEEDYSATGLGPVAGLSASFIF